VLKLLELATCEHSEHMRDGSVIEASFALFDEEREMMLGYAVIAAQMVLGPVPEILDSVNVIVLVSKRDRMVDPQMPKLRDVEHVVAAESIGEEDAVGLNFSGIIGISVSERESGMITTCTFPCRFNRPQTLTFPAPQRRLPFCWPPK
jgi:hypothetical protein